MAKLLYICLYPEVLTRMDGFLPVSVNLVSAYATVLGVVVDNHCLSVIFEYQVFNHTAIVLNCTIKIFMSL